MGKRSTLLFQVSFAAAVLYFATSCTLPKSALDTCIVVEGSANVFAGQLAEVFKGADFVKQDTSGLHWASSEDLKNCHIVFNKELGNWDGVCFKNDSILVFSELGKNVSQYILLKEKPEPVDPNCKDAKCEMSVQRLAIHNKAADEAVAIVAKAGGKVKSRTSRIQRMSKVGTGCFN